MTFLDRYWVDSPRAFEKRMKEIVSLYSDKIEPFELCETASGVPVPGFRMGRGERHVFLLGRVHGHEPSGTCGLVALIEGLANSNVPDTGKPFGEAQRILDHFTIRIFPLVNPTAAERFSTQIKDSYIGNLAPKSSAKNFEEWLHNEYEPILHEPGLTLKKRRPAYFELEELKALEKIGKPIGTLFTEDGVELWKDWVNEKAPQTRALKQVMRSFRPVLLVDIHNDSPPTRICPPTQLRKEDVSLYERLGNLVYDALERASIPSSRRVEPYIKDVDTHQSVSWAYNNLGTIQFLYEVNGLGSKEHMVLSVWYGITALLLGIMDKPSGST